MVQENQGSGRNEGRIMQLNIDEVGIPGEIHGWWKCTRRDEYKNRLRSDQIHVYNPGPFHILFQLVYYRCSAVCSREGPWKVVT